MNFIAHLYLSCCEDDILLGNFMGDFVRNAELPEYSATMQQGVMLHRQIDTFTDNHPMVIQGMRRLYPLHGKYASVLVDIFYDYLLAAHWNRFADEDFDDFIERMYVLLSSNRQRLPATLQQRLPHMIDDDWLRSYTGLEGLRIAFGYLSRRVSRPELIAGAVDSLERDLPKLEIEFLHFFPEVEQHVAAWLEENGQPKG